MKFGQFPIDDATGFLLAHSLRFSGVDLSKGHVLKRSDLQRLKAAGLKTVTAARLESDDLSEDDAASMLAVAASADSLRFSEARTGRVNVYSTVKGVFVANKAVIDCFNSIDPAITVACLADHSRVNADDLVATFKIIPLAVPRSKIEAACSVMKEQTAFCVRPFKRFAVSLIATELPRLKPSVMDKTARILARRLAVCGNSLQRESRTTHETQALSEALREVSALQDDAPKLIVVFGASAVIDEGDVIPQAIREAGGTVLRVGMPVDPGNLLVLGLIGETHVIGAPGCARSPMENGFDWILERVLTGEKPDGGMIAGLGVGGLLKEIRSRPMPRDNVSERQDQMSVAIVLLAAGMSSRMGSSGLHKLLAEFDGIPLLRRTATVAVGSKASSVALVLGHRADDLINVLSGLKLSTIINPDYASGMASSLATGFATQEARNADGIMVMLADMPDLSSVHLDQLIDAFDASGATAIVRAVFDGKPGNPVILPRSLHDAILRLEGDVGARHLIETSGLPIINVEIGSAAQVDVDTPQAVEAAGGVLVESLNHLP
ncbi:molybdenum cofactor cytidylyltransferase [Rhizobium skierniewicense]|uniref:Molybdenum cofactor cytidylyltransferase n=1 Tax=Rhizobium skierniewicense TaxID=984260 RepID=A0A7W6C9S9_9HYPH|nr:molybdopterin-binding/glycosyltransferase family 2 protein [Rhizobium skierniewicense]MBB3944490.1 molybdenum cofactor cytidylyltransferase [Rhizobium skierniewicense]